MTITIKSPQIVSVGSTATTLYTGTSATKIRIRELQITNVGATSATITVTLNNGTTTANRVKNFPLGVGNIWFLSDFGCQPGDIIQVQATAGTVDAFATVWEYT